MNLILVSGTATTFIRIVRDNISELPVRATGINRIRRIIPIQHSICTGHYTLYILLTFYLSGQELTHRLLRKK